MFILFFDDTFELLMDSSSFLDILQYSVVILPFFTVITLFITD